MTTCISHSHVAAYVSGMALGAIVLLTAVAPHVNLDRFSLGQAAEACADRLTPGQAEILRGAVLEAESRRDGLLRGGSGYAAAKIGVAPRSVDASELGAADTAMAAARARLTASCV